MVEMMLAPFKPHKNSGRSSPMATGRMTLPAGEMILVRAAQ